MRGSCCSLRARLIEALKEILFEETIWQAKRVRLHAARKLDANRASAFAKSVYPETGGTETGSCGSSLATGASGGEAPGADAAGAGPGFGSCGSTWGMGAVKGPSVAR